MQSEVRQLVAEHSHRVPGIGTGAAPLHDDAVLGWDRDRRAPLGGARAYPVAEAALIGRDRDEYSLARPRESREGVVGDCAVENRASEARVTRVRDDGDPAAVQPERSLLRGRAEATGRDQQERDDYCVERDGAPPSSTCFNISAQRFPHGLNLFAATPSRQAWRAAPFFPPNQRARPSS